MHDHQPDNQEPLGSSRPVARRVASARGAPSARTPYDAAFRAVYGRLAVEAGALEQDRTAAGPLAEELLAQPARRRTLLLGNSRRFASWGLAEGVLNRARRAWGHDPAQAIELAELAISILDHLPRDCGRRMVADLTGRAWAYLATARRLAGDSVGARRGFNRAERLLRAGTGDPFELSQLFDLRAAQEIENGRLEPALDLLDLKAKLYQRIDDADLSARTLFDRARLAGLAGRGEEALAGLRGAAALDPRNDHQLHLAILHAEVEMLSELGRHGEAWKLLPGVRRQTLRFGDHRAFLALRRLDGRIADRLGFQARAEASLATLFEAYREHRRVWDAATVFLDLIVFFVRHRRAEEAVALGNRFLRLAAPGSMTEQARAIVVGLVCALRQGEVCLERAREARGRFLDLARRADGLEALTQNSIVNALSELSIDRLWRVMTEG